MKLYCKVCELELSNEIIPLPSDMEPVYKDKTDVLPQGFYYTSDERPIEDSKGWIYTHLKDIINAKYHPEKSSGCCGMDGLDGMNLLCLNGHEFATEVSDCWTPHFVKIEPEKVIKMEGERLLF